MKKLTALLCLLALTGCANLKVEWAVQASYSSANAKEAKADK